VCVVTQWFLSCTDYGFHIELRRTQPALERPWPNSKAEPSWAAWAGPQMVEWYHEMKLVPAGNGWITGRGSNGLASLGLT
jgi:hypothetical protein